MSDAYQFPPSSPLAHGDYEVADTFNHKSHSKGYDGRGRYPTPNPSSTTGRSSSPIRNVEDDENEEIPDTFAIKAKPSVTFKLPCEANRDFQVVDPSVKVLKVPLISTKSQLIIGRSSKSSDIQLNGSDKTISRSHIKILYTKDTIVLTCLGYNGFAMRIPKPCQVSVSDKEANKFIITEIKTPLDTTKLSPTNKSIRLENDHTEFAVNRKETVELPRFSNIMVEIRDHVMLINPMDIDEELTDDEEPVLIQNTEPVERKEVEAKPVVEKVPKVVQPVKKAVQGPESTPLKVTSEKPSPFSPRAKNAFNITPEEPTPTKVVRIVEPQVANVELLPEKPKVKSILQQSDKLLQNKTKSTFEIFEDSTSKRNIATPPPSSLPNRPSTPLNDKSSSLNISTPPPKRKAISEEPPVLKTNKVTKKKKQEPHVEINQSCIENVSNILEINNILINHLAFSRLSSTPASFLNTISAVVSKLTLEQLRVILNNLSCIGVIYREGKDAAGKPLEEEYYYIPERDNDSERPKLVSSIKGHGGLRSCRRTHKQYYWKKPAPIKK